MLLLLLRTSFMLFVLHKISLMKCITFFITIKKHYTLNFKLMSVLQQKHIRLQVLTQTNNSQATGGRKKKGRKRKGQEVN